MSKCPFWSTKKEKVSCYNECPMYPISKDDEVCPFMEHLTGNKISYNDIEDDFAYSQENIYDLSFINMNSYE